MEIAEKLHGDVEEILFRLNMAYLAHANIRWWVGGLV